MLGPPGSEKELLMRSRAIAGMTVAELARDIGWSVPQQLHKSKGFVGRLLEATLGAQAGNRAEPDFPVLGIELKSVPLGRMHHPLESTFVCHASLTSIGNEAWETSTVYRKLARVLWIPVQGVRSVPLPERIIGTGVLWTPSTLQMSLLRSDWEELAGRVGRGEAEFISARVGVTLQLRPKGANARARSWALDEDGTCFRHAPRAFYLRAAFTRQILDGSC
ncbi:MAG: DNA mismatch repair endonuclease MutH [Myxococcales bacterium]|nr:DNA mismatch repair endonuclease MutH [Myxococcales bacterium]